ncbi:hypothetical protein E2562_014366 [Oryza meyeriana var. granulata]|nr:hypothetical protein E2562_014366 [Oryza meyeriana var. granulata]
MTSMSKLDHARRSGFDSQGNSVQLSSNGGVEDGLPSMVGLEDYGDCNREARHELLSLDWTEGNPCEKDGAGLPIERTVVDNVDTIADITREYADPQMLAPVVGQSFKTERDAFNFYNVYAVSKGFSIRLSRDRLNSDKNKTMREICCSHEGKNLKTKKRSARVGCRAMIRINRPSGDGSWSVIKVVVEHNHPMKGRIGVTKNY